MSEHGKHKHEEQIADQGYNTMSRYILVHLPIPIPKATRAAEAKVAVGKECNKLEDLPAWQEYKVRNKKKVIEEAQKGGAIQFMLQRSWTGVTSRIQNWTSNARSTRGASYYVVMQ